jgi:hypothetical protein
LKTLVALLVIAATVPSCHPGPFPDAARRPAKSTSPTDRSDSISVAALDSILRVRLDSALRFERSKGIFIDTTTRGRAARDLPLMIFSDAQLTRLNKDTVWRRREGDSTYALIDHSQLYRIGVTDSTGTARLVDPYYAAARTQFVGIDGAAATASVTSPLHLEALDAPNPNEFPNVALTLPLHDGRSTLASYVETRLWNQGWSWNEDVQQAKDSTVVRFVTIYLSQPSSPDNRRERRVSYLLSVSDSTRGACRRVSIRWLTQSKGVRESRWITLPDDSLYRPASTNMVRDWFANLQPCRR